MINSLFIYLYLLVSDFDPSETLDSSQTPLTRDFIGLCIGILSVVFVIIIVVICKWSRCVCLKHSDSSGDQNEVLSSILQHNTSPSRSYPHHPYYNHNQQQHSSSCDSRPVSSYQQMSNTRDDLTGFSQNGNSGHRLNDIKVPRVTITTLPVQPSQQLVPRLSLSPQVSSSSIARSTYSFKQ